VVVINEIDQLWQGLKDLKVYIIATQSGKNCAAWPNPPRKSYIKPMKKPLIIMIAIVLGIMATNALVSKKNTASDQLVEDTVDTAQAAPTQVSSDIPL
jgi:hypothetical protein